MEMKLKKDSQEDNWVLTEEFGDKGIITLNRPKALNALNFEMARKLSEIIAKWQNTKSLIIIKGNGKSFCAGGDVKANIRFRHVLGPTSRIIDPMCFMIANLKPKYVSLIDGYVMGAGVGISVHGKYRVATERTVFAMPETAIGYFPDVAASYLLPRLQGKIGFYLGMTGAQLKGGDVLHAGIATHFCESSDIPKLEAALLALENTNEVEDVLCRFSSKPISEFTLAKHIDQINRSFDATSVEEIFENLEKDDSEWAQQTLKKLKELPPKSLKLTFRAFTLGLKLSLGECMQMEYRLCMRHFDDHDYNEGFRALFVDKNKKPKWNPSRLEDISEEMVNSYFLPLPNNDELAINVKLTSKL